MAVNKHDLLRLTLVDGLPTRVDGKSVVYKQVILRETTVADEIKANALAEKLVMYQGKPVLAVNEDTYTLAMTMLSCERFVCAPYDDIDQTVMSLDLFGKLSRPDLAMIEERVSLVELSAQVRHGLLSEQEFAQLFNGTTSDKPPTKQPEGQAAAVAEADGSTGPDLEQLTDRTAERA